MTFARQPQLKRLVGAEATQAERVGRHLEQRPCRCQTDQLAVVDLGSALASQAADLMDHARDPGPLPVDQVHADLGVAGLPRILKLDRHFQLFTDGGRRLVLGIVQRV